MSQRNEAGGRAGAGGFDYQHRCAAWLAVRVLASSAAAPLLSLWSTTLDRLDSETGEPVDDVRVRPLQGPPVAFQFKRTIDLSTSADSELAKTVRQFVEQHRLEGHAHDKMVLAVGPQASGQVRNTLRLVLDRLRDMDSDKSISDTPLNDEERHAFTVIADHVDRCWLACAGTNPTLMERDAVLRSCHVLTLDVDPGGSHENEARQLLRQSVAAEPVDADAAWAVLIEHCARMAADRSGANRDQLQAHLLSRNIRLRTVIDFDEDIARLRQVSAMTLASLEANCLTIPSPDGAIILSRQSVDDLAEQAAAGPLLVIGDPGIGKSVALHHLALTEISAGRPVVMLSVGSTSASSLGELRNELGLDHDFLDVLAQWSPGEPKLLIVDSLDAARNEPQADLWRVLIGLVNANLPHWHVVASVRTWDLRHSSRLRSQFPGEPALLGDLRDEELHQVSTAWPALGALIASAPADLRRLLRNPFNLRLAAELLLVGATAAELHDVRDRLQLLDQYWRHRVSDGSDGTGRHALLTRVCDLAVREKTLMLPTSTVVDGDVTSSRLLDSLLSRTVLVDATALPGLPGLGAVRFAHHVLFDYAVALTLFAPTLDALLRRLADDPDLLLFARPSIDMHLERTWSAGPAQFWDTAFAVAAAEELQRLATVAIAEVAGRRATELADLEPLIGPIIAGVGSDVQHRLLRYLAIAIEIDRNEQVAPVPGILPVLLERLSGNVGHAEVALRVLLDNLLRHGGPLSESDLALCGVAARRQLDFVWNQPSAGTTRLAIEAVVATAASDPEASGALLYRGLEPDHIAVHGADDLHWLCDAVAQLAPIVPAFVEDLYVVVMQYDEQSTEPTRLLASRILPLTSTRRQDVEMARWNLVQRFTAFLASSPRRALAALSRLIFAQTDQGDESAGELNGRTIHLVADGSAEWDHRLHSNGHELTDLLASFEEFLVGLDKEQVDRWLDLLAEAHLPCAVFRRLLAAAAHNEYLAARFDPLDAAVTTWVQGELTEPLADLLRARFATRLPAERSRIEDTVRDLDPGTSDESHEWYKAHTRYRHLLHSLDPAALVTDAARVSQSAAAPPHRWIDDIASFRSAEGELERFGFRLTSESDRDLWPLVEQLRTFVDEYLNGVAPPAEIATSRTVVEVLRLSEGFKTLTDPVREFAESTIARAAEIWTRSTGDLEATTWVLAKELLLGFASHRLPTPSAQDADVTHPLIPQGPRTEAAQGLLQLSRFSAYIDDDVIRAIESLASDEVTWIRQSIARSLPHLRGTAPDIMWRLLHEIVEGESGDLVLQGVARAGWSLRSDVDKAVDLLTRVVHRAMPGKHHDSALDLCGTFLALIWVFQANPEARAALGRLMDFSIYGTNGLTGALHEIRTAGALTSNDNEIRRRALEVCGSLVDMALEQLGDLDDTTQEAGDGRAAQIRSAVEVLDGVASQLYFASGAFDERRNSTADGPSESAIRLVDETEGLITRLGRVPLPRLIHHLVELMAFVLDSRPQHTLFAVRDVVTSGGQRGGYQLDKMGVDMTVGIVERLLADHRGILQDQSCVTALRQILDVFVDAGWPAAHRLAYGLEHIFR